MVISVLCQDASPMLGVPAGSAAGGNGVRPSRLTDHHLAHGLPWWRCCACASDAPVHQSPDRMREAENMQGRPARLGTAGYGTGRPAPIFPRPPRSPNSTSHPLVLCLRTWPSFLKTGIVQQLQVGDFPPPSHPNVSFDLKMDSELERTVVKVFGLDSKFQKWLSAEGIETMDDVALLAMDEQGVESKVVPAAKAGGVPTEGLMDVVRIKKVWKACRASQEGTSVNPLTFESDVPLGEVTRNECDKLWLAKHGFTIGAGRLLVPQQQAPMHSMIHAAAKDFPLIPLRRLRVQSGSSEDTKGNIEEEAFTVHAIYLKLRAFWTTMAYLSIDQPSFLTFQAADELTDKILDWLHRRHHSGRPPASFFVAAWESTARVLQTGVRAGKPLRDVLEADSSFQHFWTVYVQTESHSQQAPRQNKGDTMKEQKGQNRGGTDTRLANLQRQKDQQIAQLKRELEKAKGSDNSWSQYPDKKRKTGGGWDKHR